MAVSAGGQKAGGAKRRRYTFSNYGPIDSQGYSAYQKQEARRDHTEPYEQHDARDYEDTAIPEQDQ